MSSRRLGAGLGLERLYFKHEGVNPSGAFKDRTGATVTALAIDTGANLAADKAEEVGQKAAVPFAVEAITAEFDAHPRQ